MEGPLSDFHISSRLDNNMIVMGNSLFWLAVFGKVKHLVTAYSDDCVGK